jgi:phage terminase small subunit
MPKLNDQQAIFIHEYVCGGGNASKAAREAGYSEKSAGQYAHELLQKPHIQAAIHAEQARQIGGELASMAVGVIRNILKDTSAANSVRLDAAKTALHIAGHVAPKAAEPPENKDKALSDMTADELESFIRRGRKALEKAEADMDHHQPQSPASNVLSLSV